MRIILFVRALSLNHRFMEALLSPLTPLVDELLYYSILYQLP